MERIRAGATVALLIGAGLFASPLLATPPALKDFAALPVISLVDLSPAGDRMAFLAREGGRARVVVADLASGETLSETGLDLEHPSDLVLLEDGSVIVFTRSARVSWRGSAREASYAYHVDGTRPSIERLLVGYEYLALRQGVFDRVVGLAPDGQSVYMPAFVSPRERGHATLALLEVSLETYAVDLLELGQRNTVDWFVDGAGRAVAREDYDDRRDVHALTAIGADGSFNELFRQETAVPTVEVVGLSRDERSVVVLGQGTVHDGTELYLLDREDGGIRPTGLGRPNETIDRVIMDLNRRVAGVAFAGLMPSYRFLDPELEARVAAIQGRFEGTSVHLADWSDDFRLLLFRVSGSLNSGAWVVDDAQSELHWLGDERPKITAPASVEIIRYAARDGLEIPALLTLPRKASSPNAPPVAQQLPLVVLPHGGPKDNDELGFDWLAQYLARLGVVVLQPQFRGSTGQGIAFQQRGLGEWGRAMSTDLDDGVRFLVDQGLVDPERVCVIGSSYGGYAALAAGAFSEVPYRCLVSISGISDLRRLLLSERRRTGGTSWSVDYLERQFGADSGDRKALKSRSPVAFADRFSAPVLLLHGEEDTVVPVDQSETMARALERAGKPVDLVLMPGGEHWLTQASTRREVLERIEAFLRKHLL